jgi:IS5 family transposase
VTGHSLESPLPGNWHGGFGGRPCGKGPARLAPRRMVDPTDHLQDLGMRKARYRGRRKTRLQALLAATVANIKRLAVLGAFAHTPAIAH